jgi:hypothetical protein
MNGGAGLGNRLKKNPFKIERILSTLKQLARKSDRNTNRTLPPGLPTNQL